MFIIRIDGKSYNSKEKLTAKAWNAVRYDNLDFSFAMKSGNFLRQVYQNEWQGAYIQATAFKLLGADGAASTYDDALRAGAPDPVKADIYSQMALCCIRNGNHKSVIDYFDKSLNIIKSGASKQSYKGAIINCNILVGLMDQRIHLFDNIAANDEAASKYEEEYEKAKKDKDNHESSIIDKGNQISSKQLLIEASRQDLEEAQTMCEQFNLTDTLGGYHPAQLANTLINIFKNEIDGESLKIKQAILDLPSHSYDVNYSDGEGDSLLKLVLAGRCGQDINVPILLTAGLNMGRKFIMNESQITALKLIIDALPANHLVGLNLASQLGIKDAVKDLVVQDDGEAIKKLLSAAPELALMDVSPDIDGVRSFQLLHLAVVKGKTATVEAVIESCPQAIHDESSDYGKPALLVFEAINLEHGASELTISIINLFKEGGLNYSQELLQVISSGNGLLMSKMLVAMPELLEADYDGQSLADIIASLHNDDIAQAFAAFMEESYWANMGQEFEAEMAGLGSDVDSLASDALDEM